LINGKKKKRKKENDHARIQGGSTHLNTMEIASEEANPANT
jgi:hypothetical protein